jgi:phenylalanyl-tRNA synthetase beta chain
MNISYNWLRTLLPKLSDSPDQVAARLAMYGAPVDEIVPLGEPLRDIVIARVVAARPHPNSDHLSLCQVDAGSGELLSVVCGAPNVRAECFYPFAPVGATLPGGLTIGQRKIRGEESQGMLCSARELNLGREHEGILELQGTFTPGESFIRAVDLDDYRLVIDVTPNRPDLLSHLGIARELASRGERSIVLPRFPRGRKRDFTVQRATTDGEIAGVRVRIEEPEACPRYMAAVIGNVRMGPAPEWLAARLRAVGQRPISNVVDATNFVLQELGQPLHAFDLKRLRGPAIVVRNARVGEKLVTLDGVERSLEPDMLVIADAEHATAIAGVMGGQLSEVNDQTVDVLIECAHFEPRQIRATRRRLGMSTDASYRFERGVDPTAMERALRRVVDLIVACAGGECESELLDVSPVPMRERQLTLRPSRVAQVLGETFTPPRITGLLEPIGFKRVGTSRSPLKFDIPGHRWFDVLEEIDLVEEVARRHGYNEFAADLRPFRPSAVPDHPLSVLEDGLRTKLVGAGLLEARTAGFAPESEGDVALQLPLSSAESHLRRALLPGLLHRVEYNYTRGARDIRLFELGTAFAAKSGPTPDETTRLAIAITGARAPQHWMGASGDYSIWDIKGLAEDIAAPWGLSVRAGLSSDLRGITKIFEPDLTFEILADGAVVGQAGQIRSGAIDSPAWATSLFGLELILSEQFQTAGHQYRALPVFPAIEQDLSLLVPDSISAAQVEHTLRAAGGPLLEETVPIDVYRGAGLPVRTRSIAFRLRFRASDRTLTDGDARTLVGRILKRLQDEHGIERRG